MKKHLLVIIVLFAITTLHKAEAQSIKLWGVTYAGAKGTGNIFECNQTGTITDTCDFDTSSTNAEGPEGSLIKAYNGLLYGMSYKGGTNNDGAIFSYNTLTNKAITLHSFGSGKDGYYPYNGSLLQGSDSLLYGMTQDGGINGYGVIFSYNISQNMYNYIYSFGNSVNDGTRPAGSLIQVTDSLLYGMTEYGGSDGYGTIFSYNIKTGKEKDLHDFGYNYDGTYPYGSLTKVSDSVLYGMTSEGGNNSEGIIFSYNIVTGKETDKYDFGSWGDDAAEPYGSLLLANDGLLYGFTYGGGFDEGTIFSFNMKTDSEIVLHIFGNNYDGSYPYGDLIQASNGLLYGLTEEGGANDEGMIFSYNIDSGTETDIHDFAVASGDEPYGDLLEDDTTTLGINQLTAGNVQLSVYPNPSSNYIHASIQLTQPANLQLRLINMLGQTVWVTNAGTVSNYESNISVAVLADGVYVLQMVTSKGTESKEVVIAHN